MATIDEIAELERQLGQQRVENAYYRDCYALFKLLQDLTEKTSHDLQRLYNSDHRMARAVPAMKSCGPCKIRYLILLRRHATPKKGWKISVSSTHPTQLGLPWTN
jgi:hypothetical protein